MDAKNSLIHHIIVSMHLYQKEYEMYAIDTFTFIGLAAATFTTVSFLPQAVRTIKTKQTRDLSLGMYAIFSTGTFLWLIYGLIIKDIPVVAANSITFMLSFTILVLKIKYK